jgi:hypothetical protein
VDFAGLHGWVAELDVVSTRRIKVFLVHICLASFKATDRPGGKAI